LALEFLSGNESPTAARMNELWGEADSIIGKAMDGKSTYLVQTNGIIAPTESIYFGKEFFFYTPGNHDADNLSVLHAVRQPLPASYNQATYDAAASGASLGYADSTNRWALSDQPLGLDFSLKAHTRDVGGVTHFLWDTGQPNPEKIWRFAVAELLIGDTVDNSFDFLDEWNKYNCFKIHNLTQNEITFHFGASASPHFSLTIPAFSQQCVRRDSVTSGYDATYGYFFKTFAGDPRFLHFKSHAGFVPNSMRANNITNASFLYNILEAIGQRADSSEGYSAGTRTITKTSDAPILKKRKAGLHRIIFKK